jgi:glutaminyl-peptide cyclotransferase
MHCHKTLALAALLLAIPLAAQQPPKFSGTSALEFTRRIVAFGQRPAGSEALARARAYILTQLKPYGCEVTEDAFTANTPAGTRQMKNLIARFPGRSGRVTAITGHYDTKAIPGVHFVGANDGGASAGFLLEMARVVARMPHKDDIFLVWLDGEEAFGQWSATNGIYGSRHLAARWAGDGTLRRIKALINVDMIGDRDLGILDDMNSAGPLRELIWRTADSLGLGRHFLREPGAIEDDHVPFLQRGVNAVDLIDFDYGPENSWWHTEQDTMDKLGASSLETVGAVLTEVLKRLD